jgi:membrane protease YdiL (CAAX protease family)
MTGFIGRELAVLRSQVRGNLNELTVVCSAALFIALARYHSFDERWSEALVFYAALPILTILLVLRRNPLDFGLRLGNWRLWLPYVVITVIVAAPILVAASRVGSLDEYYSVEGFDLSSYAVEAIVYLAAWEFLFRGYLLSGLRKRFGEASILIQMIPFVLLHLGKPELETLSTIPMGLYLGFVAYRGGSVWPAVIIHVVINISFRALVN